MAAFQPRPDFFSFSLGWRIKLWSVRGCPSTPPIRTYLLPPASSAAGAYRRCLPRGLIDWVVSASADSGIVGFTSRPL